MEHPEWRAKAWYHGSPRELDELAVGSTITPNRALARAFSHKPTLVCIEDDGTIRHNGAQAGILYRIEEPLAPGDIHPHPRSTMPDGLEWLTTRPLRLHRLGRTHIGRQERISDQEARALLARRDRMGSGGNTPRGSSEETAEHNRIPH